MDYLFLTVRMLQSPTAPTIIQYFVIEIPKYLILQKMAVQ